MIDGPGHPTGHLVIPLKEETTMLKTISAALLAVSVLAAPALAAGQATNQATKTAQAPVIKAEQVKQTKPSVLKANARMGRHHVRHASYHRSHPQAYRRAEGAQVLEGFDQARYARHQARLKTDPRGVARSHCPPPLPADIRSGPRHCQWRGPETP
jgi:hypothetical protein